VRLLSVNVGTPRQVSWKGRHVTTAILKQSVTGPRFVGRINVEGDDQADRLAHGGEHRAVFVYQIESSSERIRRTTPRRPPSRSVTLTPVS
jgi:MOSC domain-containing protein YiiM